MCADVSVLPTTRARHASSPLSVPCLCVWTKAGIKSSSTCPTSQDAPMERTTSRRSGCKSMPTAAFAASTFPIACTLKMSCRLNSSSSCPLPNSRTPPVLVSNRWAREYKLLCMYFLPNYLVAYGPFPVMLSLPLCV